MAVVTVYQHGIKAGVAPGTNDHQRAKRKAVSGWTAKSSASNLDFLRSVLLDQLDGIGYCITLTVKKCPDSAIAWDQMRTRYVDRLRYAGMIRLHWVTEWQRRGVPHLHGIVYFPEPNSELDIVQRLAYLEDAWLDICQDVGADTMGQKIVPISDELGWIKYLAKHAARGCNHYQRSSENMPDGWKGLSGRMWGKSGDWPVSEPVVFEMQAGGFWRLRRAMRAWRRADARSGGSGKRIRSARACLRCYNKKLSAVRGVSEWVPESTVLTLVDWIVGQGYTVLC